MKRHFSPLAAPATNSLIMRTMMIRKRRRLIMLILMSKKRSPDLAEYHADLVADQVWYYLVILASIVKQIVIKS